MVVVSTMKTPMPFELVEEYTAAFWGRVDTSGDCWEWTGSKAHGYGRLKVGKKGRSLLAHRYSWHLHTGDDPGPLFVCHTCDNPSCVNPDHLFLGTQGDNIRDAQKKGRLSARGKGWRREITHCPAGHAYTPENTRHTTQARGRAMRICRQCHRQRQARYNRRNRNMLARKAGERRAAARKS